MKHTQVRKFVIDPPVPLDNRTGIAIVTKSLNDEDYVGEWVEFHLAAGVSHFFIYLDGDFSTKLPLYAKNVPNGSCTFIPWQFNARGGISNQNFNTQSLSCAHAIGNFGARYKRMAFIDIDEFIVPKGHNSINEALKAIGEFTNISLPWHMFGFNGHDTKPSASVVSSYTRRARSIYSPKGGYLNFKCIVDPCDVTNVGVHSFETKTLGAKSANTEGAVCAQNMLGALESLNSSNLQLNHYYTRSKSELSKKINRGSNTKNDAKIHNTRVNKIVEMIEIDMVEDLSAIEFLNSAHAIKTRTSDDRN